MFTFYNVIAKKAIEKMLLYGFMTPKNATNSLFVAFFC